MFGKLRKCLELSLRRQKQIADGSIVLNPVESVPMYLLQEDVISFTQGYYVSDRLKNRSDPGESKIIFAGRRRGTVDTQKISAFWAKALGGAQASLRLLSGLHAHVSIFMGLGTIGDTVLLLPEIGGGHMATAGILSRLGYHVIEMEIDREKLKVNIEATKRIIAQEKPKFLFVDRSEGLSYEDFSELLKDSDVYSVFDASQYLPGILSGIYRNPFEMGFNLMISTLHKSFPGPQKAIVVTKSEDSNWLRISAGLKNFVSSSHIKNTYLAAFSFETSADLTQYASTMIENTLVLEKSLNELNVPVIKRDTSAPATHHLWISMPTRNRAFQFYRNLEKARLLTNFRQLPYDLGFGLRLGTSSATLRGFAPEDFHVIANLISLTFHKGYLLTTRHKVRDLCIRLM